MRTPKALLIQGASNSADETMLQLARIGRPQRRWWWGVRRWHEPAYTLEQVIAHDTAGTPLGSIFRTGAWCYVCDRPITTWSGRWPMTVDAKLAVQRHRTEHIQGRLDTPPTGDET